jgi:polyhydroxyalkanoate synthase subunit PhaC
MLGAKPQASDPAAQALGANMTSTLKALTALQLPLERISQVQNDYVAAASQLWNRMVNAPVPGLPVAPLNDRRFAAKEWAEQPTAHFNAQLYLLNTRTMLALADSVQGCEKIRQRLRFAVQQATAAASPANWLALNPEAISKAIHTQGESLNQGITHLWRDLQKGQVSQTNEAHFELGKNVAATPGSVVFENHLFQLIEYQSTTTQVFEKPLLIVPPCINKYYILDLQPANSLVRHAVEQGHRVFIISWRSPDESMAHLQWDDYIEHAVIRALQAVRDITGQPQLSALGFCIGGTLLSTALAVLAARGDQAAASLTLLTTLLDFTHTGVLDVFIDEAMVQMREMTIGPNSTQKGGLLKGQELASTFSALRPSEMVWSYVIGNYLKGEMPAAFDMLYWNSDVTHLPGPMYCWYLRHTYLENRLAKPEAASVCGQPLDLAQVQAPAYIYASRDDHIVPWEGAYLSLKALSGCKRQTRFVLGASGHIAGVINPPASAKRSYWVGAKNQPPAKAQTWLDSAQERPGSWWTDWHTWLAAHAGKPVAAPRNPGSKQYPVIEPAPGRYVRRKVI